MPSTDLDGAPILILRLEDVRIFEECMTNSLALLSSIAQFKETYQRVTKFLDSCDSIT